MTSNLKVTKLTYDVAILQKRSIYGYQEPRHLISLGGVA
jgi:hypothetical protein